MGSCKARVGSVSLSHVAETAGPWPHAVGHADAGSGDFRVAAAGRALAVGARAACVHDV